MTLADALRQMADRVAAAEAYGATVKSATVFIGHDGKPEATWDVRLPPPLEHISRRQLEAALSLEEPQGGELSSSTTLDN